MTLLMPVPSDVEPTCLQELVADCHVVTRVLNASQPSDLTVLARLPLARLPLSFGVMPVELTEGMLVSVAGYEA